MATNIQINYLKDNGEYEILWPENNIKLIIYSTSIIGTGQTTIVVNLPSIEFSKSKITLVSYQYDSRLLFLSLYEDQENNRMYSRAYLATLTSIDPISNCVIKNNYLTFNGLHPYYSYADKEYYISVISFV